MIMSHPLRIVSHDKPRGITLLEVLISIGILSIGLLSALALIPAGRTYIKQAEQDDRSSTIVPSAIATMESLGLFHEKSLEWHRDVTPVQGDGEQAAERPAFMRNALQPYFGGTKTAWEVEEDRRNGGFWNLSDEHTATIRDWHARDGMPTLRGVVAVPNATVMVKIGNGGWKTSEDGVRSQPDPDDPASRTLWDYEVDDLDFPDDGMSFDMKIRENTQGGAVGEVLGDPRFKAHSIEAKYLDMNNAEHLIPLADIIVQPPADRPVVGELKPYHHYGRRRKIDERFGDAILDLRVAPKDRRNETPDSARPLSVPGLRDQVLNNKIKMVREIDVPVAAQLWRFHEGYREAPFRKENQFANTEAQTLINELFTYPTPFWSDPAIDPLPTWVTATGSPVDTNGSPVVPEKPEDKDYFKFEVEAGVGLTVDLHTTSPPSAVVKRPVQFSTTGSGPWTDLTPYAADQYAIPNDGWIRTGFELIPYATMSPLTNTITYVYDAATSRYTPRNLEYLVDFHLVRQDRMIAIDPLMCAHLDRIIRLDPGNHPLSLRRRRFADFQQLYNGDPNSPRAFVIPRLNWRVIADNPNFDAAVAVAERLCRAEDTIALGDPANEESAPAPEFATIVPDPASPNQDLPVQRQAAGRMTWMLTVQPEDPGSVAANWYAGRYFDVSIVIFEDRPVPPNDPKLTTFDGEYAFQATWGQLDGLLRVFIPTDGPTATAPSDEDIRRIIAPGGWLLLAPSVTLTSSPIDSQLRLEWIKVRTVSLERTAAGVTATILLDKEPDTDVLVPSINGTPRADGLGRLSLIALAYDGVVSVVRRSMMVQR